jgi:LytS/YehU family sensor histidine kinase
VGVSLYFITALIYYLLLEVEKKRAAEKELLQQRLLASQAQLNALKTTIHPHFLFNSLNMIAPLAKTAPEKVRPVINQLSSFLQYSLRYGQQEFVPVKEELEHVKDYLHIESLRLGNRLKIKYDIDTDVLDQQMIPMTLLPLVENAIKHGISQSMEGGVLTITLQKKSKRIHVEVENPYESHGNRLQGEGMGLETLKKRLEVMYSHEGRLHVEKSRDLFRVVLSFPQQGDSNE